MIEPTYRIAQRLHERRAAKGVRTYGRPLDANSKGCMLVHTLEEAAYQVNYLIEEIQRRREAIRMLLDTAERLTQWDNVNLREDARQLVRVIDLLGGESALAQYDEILGTVAENATVDPRAMVAEAIAERRVSLPTDPRDEARANHKAHATQVGAVEWVCRCECGWIERYETTGEGAGALCEWHMAKAAPDPRDEALRVATEALDRAYEGAARQLAEPRNHDDDQYALTDIATTCEAALAAIRAAGGGR